MGVEFLASLGPAVQAVLQVLVIILLGFLLSRRGLLPPAFVSSLGALCFDVLLPATLFTSVLRTVTAQNLLDFWMFPVWVVIVTGSGFSLAFLLATGLQVSPDHRMLVTLTAAFPNSAYLPLLLVPTFCRLHPQFEDDLTAPDRSIAYISVYVCFLVIVLWTTATLALKKKPHPLAPDGHTSTEQPPQLLTVASVTTQSLPRDSGHGLEAQARLPVWQRSTLHGGLKSIMLSRRWHSRQPAADGVANEAVEGAEATGGAVAGGEEPGTDFSTAREPIATGVSCPEIQLAPPEGPQGQEDHPGPPLDGEREEEPFSEAAPSCGSRCWSYVLRAWRHPVVNNPLLASVAGLALGCVPPLKAVLVTPSAPLNWLFEGLATVGRAATPLAMILMGAQLQGSSVSSRGSSSPEGTGRSQRRGCGSQRLGTAVSALTRLVVVPLAAAAVAVPLDRAGAFGPDPLMPVVLLVEACTPGALNLILIAMRQGHDARAMAAVLLWHYGLSLVTLTLSLSAIMHLVYDSGLMGAQQSVLL